MIKGYNEYRNTNNVWYTEIPSHWKVVKIKHIANTYAGGTPSTIDESFWENGNIPWLPSGKLQNCEIETAEKFITEKGLLNSSTKMIKPNTVLIALTGATCANIGYLKFEACANQSVVAIDERSEKVNSRFLYYVLISMRPQILTHQTGGAQSGINDGDVKNLYLNLPLLPEQSQIVAFLDYQTGLIDALIAKKEALIEKLKLQNQAIINEAVTGKKVWNGNAWAEPTEVKDSGIEWLGEIPEEWEVTYLKRFCQKITDGSHHSPATQLEGRNYVSVKDVDQFGNIDLINCKKIDQDDFDSLVRNGCQPMYRDVLLTKDGTIGRAAVVENNDFVILSSLGLITPKTDKLNPYYLRYFLISSLNVKQMFSMIAGAALTRLTIDKINHLIITCPSLEEQYIVVKYLNDRTSKIENTITRIEVQIEKLKQYRQSLISEAVTGKIDVSTGSTEL